VKRDEWFSRQLLSGGGASIADVISRTGWIHTAGGTGPYLSLRERLATLRRQHVDDAVYRRFDVVEVPAVRDSTMLVPRADLSVALAAGRRSFDERLTKLIKATGGTSKELQTLAERILKMLQQGVRSSDALRAEMPSRYVRELGDAGKRLGFASTVPVALRMLQTRGQVLRLAEGHRLDARRYFYRLWPESLPIDVTPGDLDHALAERFISWAAPASADDFAAWAGISKTVAKRVFADLPRPSEVSRPRTKGVLLLPFRDNYFGLHRGLTDLVDEPKGIRLLDHSNKPAPIEKLESLHHNAIIADGALVGIWEYDRTEERIVWKTFRTVRGVEKAITATEEFIREELGDHKYYAFDQGRTRETRLQVVRGA
jgi:hypothetical protein